MSPTTGALTLSGAKSGHKNTPPRFILVLILASFELLNYIHVGNTWLWHWICLQYCFDVNKVGKNLLHDKNMAKCFTASHGFPRFFFRQQPLSRGKQISCDQNDVDTRAQWIKMKQHVLRSLFIKLLKAAAYVTYKLSGASLSAQPSLRANICRIMSWFQ